MENLNRVNFEAGFTLKFVVKAGYKRINWNITATSADGSEDGTLTGVKLEERVNGLYYNGKKLISYQKMEISGTTTYTFDSMCAYDLRFSIEVEPEN